MCRLTILPGTISQWGEVSKNKKDKARLKTKDVIAASTLTDVTNHTRHARGGRGAFEGSRGGHGRGADRGRGTGRGGRGASVATHTNGTRAKEEWPTATTEEPSIWENAKQDPRELAKPESNPMGEESVEAPFTATRVAETEASTVSSIIPEGTKKSWASILKPVPAPEPKKKAPVPVEK